MSPPDDGDSWRRDERNRYADRSQGELLAVIADKVDRFDRELQAMRREALEGRAEFRNEQADAIKLLRDSKADTYRVKVLEMIVYGFVGIILVAVAYALLEARPVIPPDRPLGEHTPGAQK